MLLIRRARPDDAPALQELYLCHLTASPPEHPGTLSQWQEMLSRFARRQDYFLLVGEEAGRVVSSVTLILIDNLTHAMRPYALIENVVTHRDFRGKGYASALLEEASRLAGEAGCYKIMLLTGSKRESTLRFYERNGFVRGEKTGFLKRLYSQSTP